jgi:hypothetical protein
MNPYVKPTIVSVARASNAIAIGLHGSNPETKHGILTDFANVTLMRSTSGAYQADE